jgi:hypothetical protein
MAITTSNSINVNPDFFFLNIAVPSIRKENVHPCRRTRTERNNFHAD